MSICCALEGLITPIHPYMPSNPTNIYTLHPYALRQLLQVFQDNSGQQYTKWHQQTFPDTKKGCSRMCGGLCWHWMAFAVDTSLVSVRVWCRLFRSYVFLRCNEDVHEVSQRVSECWLWTGFRFECVKGCIRVFRPCMLQQTLFMRNARKGKTSHNWQF